MTTNQLDTPFLLFSFFPRSLPPPLSSENTANCRLHIPGSKKRRREKARRKKQRSIAIFGCIHFNPCACDYSSALPKATPFIQICQSHLPSSNQIHSFRIQIYL